MPITDSYAYKISDIVLPLRIKFTAQDVALRLKEQGAFVDPWTVKHHLANLVEAGVLVRRVSIYEVVESKR